MEDGATASDMSLPPLAALQGSCLCILWMFWSSGWKAWRVRAETLSTFLMASAFVCE